MSNSFMEKKAAEAIRDLVNQVQELEKKVPTYKECVKLAFQIALKGGISDSPDSIIKKADELSSNPEALEKLKIGLEMNNPYDAYGEVKIASDEDEYAANTYGYGKAELEFLRGLQEANAK